MNRTVSAVLRRAATSAFLVGALIFAAGFGSSWESDEPELMPHWKASNAASKKTVDHGDWDALLKRYIRMDKTGLNRFAYGKITKSDKARLNRYIENLSKVKVTGFNRDEQLAYWLNLYNALTIKVIVDHYPVRSIRDIDISPGVFSNGPWGKKLVKVEGRELSLDDIEHRILRPIWRDPRIHYGVNCASIGCPNLQDMAFTGKNAGQLLTIGARQYINSPRGVTIDSNKVTVSKIYSWFAYDFGNSEKGVLSHLMKYAEPKLADQLKKLGRIHNAEYDWGLNG